ncbi:MAG: adenylate/guanylate cyclase domain-containing protein [Cyanobacteria bacterium J06634_6]
MLGRTDTIRERRIQNDGYIMSRLPHDSFQKSPISWIKRRYKRTACRHRPEDQQAIAHRLGLVSGVAVAGIAIGLSALGAWRVLELQSYNLLHRTQRAIAGAPTWNDDIVVIAIDEASVEQLGRFPWPRQTYADLLDSLASAQPAAVAFDILLPDATDADQPLAESIVNSANVVLAVGNSQGQYTDVASTIANSAEGFFLRGAADTSSDEDGVSRQLHLYGERGIPSLSTAALQVYAQNIGETTQAVPSLPPSWLQHRAYRSGSHEPQYLLQDLIPEDGNVWIHWPGEVNPPGAASGQSFSQSSGQSGELQVYSYADVMSGQLDSRLFQNKIVLVGSTLIGEDTLRTPFQQAIPTSGVYLYAATINNLLDQSFLRRPAGWQTTLLLVVLAMGGTHVLRQQGVYRRLVMTAGFPMLWSLYAYAGFVVGWWLPVAAPIGTIILIALAVQLNEQQEKQQLMALLSMNVSPGTAELIWRHKGQVLDRGKLAAQSLTATVLFMDIRGFTSIAETLPAQQLLPWLNQYFDTMTDCIMAHGGMVDKYMGDAIMAVFGAPVPRTCAEEIQADAIAAMETAVEMHGRLTRLNRQLAAQHLPTIRFGIGIHTGPLVAGTVGNRHRLNYSLFGDTVNVAARLESMTKTIPEASAFKVLVSASTQEQTKEHFRLQRVKCAQLRGRKEYTEVYTLVDELSALDDSHTVNGGYARTLKRPAMVGPSVAAIAHTTTAHTTTAHGGIA